MGRLFPPPRRQPQPGQPQSALAPPPAASRTSPAMQGGDDLDALAGQHMQAQQSGQPSAYGSALGQARPPASLSMTGQQSSPFANVNTSMEQSFGRGGATPANRATTPAQMTQQVVNAGQNLGQPPPAPTTSTPTTSQAPAGPAPYNPNDPSTWGPSQAAAQQKAAQLAGQRNDPYSNDPNFDSLVDLRHQQQQDYKAEQQQLAASRAQDLESNAARAGVGGLGLSGASAALQADTGRVDDRNATLTLGQLRQQQETERWQNVLRNQVLDDLNSTKPGGGGSASSPNAPADRGYEKGSGKSSQDATTAKYDAELGVDSKKSPANKLTQDQVDQLPEMGGGESLNGQWTPAGYALGSDGNYHIIYVDSAGHMKKE